MINYYLSRLCSTLYIILLYCVLRLIDAIFEIFSMEADRSFFMQFLQLIKITVEPWRWHARFVWRKTSEDWLNDRRRWKHGWRRQAITNRKIEELKTSRRFFFFFPVLCDDFKFPETTESGRVAIIRRKNLYRIEVFPK